MNNYEKVRVIESQIEDFRIIEPEANSGVEKYIEVEFEDYFIEVKWEEIKDLLPLDKYKLATIIFLYHMHNK